MSIQIYADTSDLDQIAKYAQDPTISGFTTNPSLCRQAGVTDYETWARLVLERTKDKPVSFEVLADDLEGMRAEALEIASWGPNTWVKIPIQTVTGASTIPLIRELSCTPKVGVNVTAVMTASQAEQAMAAFGARPGIVSIFAGRIADTGAVPQWQFPSARGRSRLLWASARQLFDLHLAEVVADIITLTPALLEKRPLIGKDLEAYSLETVQQFSRDAKAAGLTLRRARIPAEAD